MSKATVEKIEEDAAGAAPKKGASPWPALIATIVLMPAISFAMTQFLLLPKLRTLISMETVKSSAGGKAKADGGGHGKSGKAGEGDGTIAYDFENVVVNLSGSMGTRYLKVSFTTLGSNPELKTIMVENKKQLLDVAINILSARSLADLEGAGAKNVVRNELQVNFNQALKSDVVEQIYFTEFVVQ